MPYRIDLPDAAGKGANGMIDATADRCISNTVIGITGPSGAGKSVFCSFLRDEGFAVLDCDGIYRSLTCGPSQCMDDIISVFGPSAAAADGSLDRNYISSIVFSPGSEDRLGTLNRITHGYVLKEVRSAIASGKPGSLFAVDAPLLFQSGFDSECTCTVAVLAPYTVRLERLLSRDGDRRSEQDLRDRMNAAPPDSWYIERCTWAVFNSGTAEGLRLSARGIVRDAAALSDRAEIQWI